MDRPGELTLRAVSRRFGARRLDDWPAAWDLDVRRQPTPPGTFVPGPGIDASRPWQERRRAPRREVASHGATRLARAIVLATASPHDPRTLTGWGLAVGASRGALRAWCTAAGVPGRACLDFLRVLRAVVLSQNQAWDPFGILDVVGQRSLNVLLDRGGVRDLCRDAPPTVDAFLRTQRFVDNPAVLRAVVDHLHAAAADPAPHAGVRRQA